MALEHWLVSRQIEPSGTDWMLSIGTGSPLSWDVGSGRSSRAKWTADALRAAVMQSVGIDVTISNADPKALMADPDLLPASAALSLICRETRAERGRWALLNLLADGNFSVAGIAVNGGIAKMIDEMIDAAKGDVQGDHTIWLRPCWFAEDIISPAMAV